MPPSIDMLTAEAAPAVDVPATAEPAARPLPAMPQAFAQFSLEGKVAVVTGGAQGLGFAMAESLCSAGLKAIAILDLRPDVGEAACASLTKVHGTPAQFFAVDVTAYDAVARIMDDIVAKFGSIDILLNSAGVVENIPAEDYSYERFKRVIDINLNGSFVCAQLAGKKMIEAGTGGSIILVGSMSGSIVNWPQPQIAYNASKAGVIHMMKTFAAEWARFGIRCNSISPGYMHTGLLSSFEPALVQSWFDKTPMKRMGEPKELQGVAVWLASGASSFCTGSDIVVDGGYTAL
ncbi:uncharacterized protein V1510DRAFT_413484 [Dipodascopsis tothii]|uniref:uncharacterized protein n=1 Tax=Dipodascopsis tothii TaxID=44089 RepID=UPI0034CFEA0D